MSNDGDPGGAEGRTVDGRYRLLERIGSGGAGTVWRARDRLTEREVAVKETRLPGDPEDDSYRRAAHRLQREARAAARVDHPCAVAIHDVVVEEGADVGGGLPWIVMELIPGENLRETLRRGPLEPAEAARVGLAVLGALRAAHAVGIVHRDVKPANVLLGPDGRIVVTDFGIAHDRDDGSGAGLPDAPEFVAPERMSGRGAGPAGDLWSLGVLLYTAVEGRSPFHRTTRRSTRDAVLAADPPEPERAGALGPLLLRLLRRDPGHRPTAEETATALEAAAGVEPVGVPAPPRADGTSRAVRADAGRAAEGGGVLEGVRPPGDPSRPHGTPPDGTRPHGTPSETPPDGTPSETPPDGTRSDHPAGVGLNALISRFVASERWRRVCDW